MTQEFRFFHRRLGIEEILIVDSVIHKGIDRKIAYAERSEVLEEVSSLTREDLSTSKPSIKILVKASEEPEIREAVVTVKSLVKNYEIHVKQLGYGPALLVKSSVSTLEAEGGEVIVTVTSNIEYAVEKSAEGDWLQAVEAPATRALVSKNYPYHAAANPLYEARTVTLTFTAYKDSLLQETLTLTQKKKASESSDVEVEGDVKLTPISAVASELQPG